MGGMYLDNDGFHRLDYSEEFPQNWPKLLSELKDSGANRFRSHVYWGAHERTKGFRDYNASSRLKLEKFLKLAHDQNLEVEVGLGFRPSSETFPTWTLSSAHKCLIPLCAWQGVFSGYALTEIPSLDDPEVGAGFDEFLRETLGLLALYRAPEGPVASVSLDLRLFRLTLNAMESAGYANALRFRYSTIEQFNQVYGVSFRDFDIVSSPGAMRTLIEKRPWLAAFDYKWCHEQAYHRRIEKLTQTVRASGLSVHLEPEPPAVSSPSAGDLEIWVDGMLAVEIQNGLFPFAPSKRADGPCVVSTRFCEYIRHHAQTDGIPFTLITSPFQKPRPSKNKIILFAGRFLARDTATALNEHLSSGGKVLFANELPQYDEKLESLSWHNSARLDPCAIDDHLWENLQRKFSAREGHA